MPSSDSTTKATNWILTVRLNMAASPARSRDGGQLVRLRRLARRVRCRRGQVAEQIAEVEIEDHVQVGVVALDRAASALRERERQRQLQGVRQILAGIGQRGQHRIQLAQRRGQRVRGGLDDVGGRDPELVQALQQPDELRALATEYLQRGWQRVERVDQHLLLLVEPGGQDVDVLDRGGDLVLLLVQAADERVQLSDQVARRATAAGQRGVELVGDRADLR